MALGPLLISGLLIVWWLLASRAPWLDRFIGLVFVVLVVVGTGAAVHPTMQAGVLFYALPVGVSVLVGALACDAQTTMATPAVAGRGAAVMTFAAWLLVRSNGMDGSMNTDFAWRWSRTAEDTFLAAIRQRSTVRRRRGNRPRGACPRRHRRVTGRRFAAGRATDD